ncbi:penicillin-binding transpeptidase domain-containing protein [Streptomyces sp. NPDC058000]|uniref:penicillin-binding transpeptidase domain-containing protein n=1 Tax=Streptomyces sp. NPDC058000 TaxID=3346299 RepID=UPI0036EBFF6D
MRRGRLRHARRIGVSADDRSGPCGHSRTGGPVPVTAVDPGGRPRAVARVGAQCLDPAHRSADRDVQVGAASVEPTTGRIVAVYGGPGYDHAHYADSADTSGVPVGSTFKPVVLAAALQHRAVMQPGRPPAQITPASTFNGDDGVTIKNKQSDNVTDDKDPTGLLHQHNDTPSAGATSPCARRWSSRSTRRTCNREKTSATERDGGSTGPRPAPRQPRRPQRRLLHRYLHTERHPHGPRLLDLRRLRHAGHPLLGHQGDPQRLRPPRLYRSRPDTGAADSDRRQRDGRPPGRHSPGTGTKAKALGRTAAGKTGTTDDYRSAWFVGYTPNWPLRWSSSARTRPTPSCIPGGVSAACRRRSAATSPPTSGPDTWVTPSPASPTPLSTPPRAACPGKEPQVRPPQVPVTASGHGRTSSRYRPADRTGGQGARSAF